MPSAPPPCVHPGAAAFAVITQRGLLSAIAACQPGVPGIVAPLVHRYEADGWMHRTARAVYVYDPESGTHSKVAVACVVSEVSGRIWPPRLWHEQCALEASAAYDSCEDGFPILRLLIDVLTRTRVKHGRDHVLRRICDAAAAFGRVDVVRWMITSHDVNFWLLFSCASTAICYGELEVLEWMESHLGAEELLNVIARPLSNTSVRLFDVSFAVTRGNHHVIHWLEAREVRPTVDATALNALIERSDVATLRMFHASPRHRIRYSNHSLLAHAVACNQPEPLAFFVSEVGMRVTVRTLERALELGSEAVATWLAEHHNMFRYDGRYVEALPTYVFERIRSRGIVGNSATNRTVQMLLPMYSTTAVAANIIAFATQNEFTK